MNIQVIVFAFLVGFLLLAEGALFLYGIRWLKSSQMQRQKDFAILDKERHALLSLQSSLMSDVSRAREECHALLSRTSQTGLEAEGEWRSFQQRSAELIATFENQIAKSLDAQLSDLHMQKMNLEKSAKETNQVLKNVVDATQKASRLLKLFDDSLPPETLAKELHAAKYSEARRLLGEGVDATAVSKKLGISYGEVVLLSHIPQSY